MQYSQRKENLLFLKQMLKNPKTIGSIIPSSSNLANFICRYLPHEKDKRIVEIGAGTGSLTQALIDSGLKRDQLTVFELDSSMCLFLKQKFPYLRILQKDADSLHKNLQPNWKGNVDVIISSIPMLNMPFDKKQAIIESCFKALSPNGYFLQFSYSFISPIPSIKLDLQKERLGCVLMNCPPATIWKYYRHKPGTPKKISKKKDSTLKNFLQKAFHKII
ncbi:MAG: class I SAM-dependent methyltransferase [Alphaproteobacteria bacterium]